MQAEIIINMAPPLVAPQVGARFARAPLGLLVLYFCLLFVFFLSNFIDFLGGLGKIFLISHDFWLIFDSFGDFWMIPNHFHGFFLCFAQSYGGLGVPSWMVS